jgi:hypothetical protein
MPPWWLCDHPEGDKRRRRRGEDQVLDVHFCVGSEEQLHAPRVAIVGGLHESSEAVLRGSKMRKRVEE